MQYWLFQGNPTYFKVLEGIRDLGQMSFPATYHIKDIAIDDEVVIWISGKRAGIYAVANVVEPAHSVQKIPDKKYWINADKLFDKKFIRVEFKEKFVENPLLKEDLKKDPILQNLLVIRNPNRATYKISLEEWEKIHEIIKKAFNL